MAIYLDANVLHSWKTFAELDRVALTIVAQQIQQFVVVPSVAAWEAEAHYRRTLERALDVLSKAQKAAKEAFRGQDLAHTPPPNVDERVEQWRDELSRIAHVVPADPADASEAHRREAFGLPPAKRLVDDRGDDVGGKGGRDAAIWLTVVRDHRSRDEEGHFISGNTSDFGETDELRPALVSDLAGADHPLRYYGSIDDFLALLGEPERGARVSLDEVARRLPRILSLVLPPTTHVPRAIFGADYDWERYRYFTDVKEARPTRVLASRRYQQQNEAITVVNAHWEIVVDCFRFEADEDVGALFGYSDALLTGTIQSYLPDDETRLAQVVSARLQATVLPPVTEGIGG